MMHDRVLALSAFEGTPLAHIYRGEELLGRWPDVESALRAVTLSPHALDKISKCGTPSDVLRFHAPITPHQVFCTIGNYRSQLLQAAEDVEDGPLGAGAAMRRQAVAEAIRRRISGGEPYICIKSRSSVADPFADLPVPGGASTLDWEVEIGVVIGRSCYCIDPEDAFDHVAGFCVVNDITLRESVFRDDPPRLGTDWVKSKGGPGWLPVGPWFVPAWQVPDPTALRPWLRLNGNLMQQGTADDMVFDIQQQISYLSRHVRLEPGDLLCTGSPAGFGSHHGRYLRVGDVLEAGVEGLGAQRVTCVGGEAAGE
jgi:2-keto-4-pentenoate hydratase/2-oxohepta-3-ene-1,7-dioic acid hydratase in catechol pathway